ncbi:MAG: SRPBCC family protein [Bacteroidota bacterium]
MLSLEQQPNHHFQYTIGVNCAQAAAWDLLTKVSDWHTWDTELKRATLFGDFELGARGEFVPKTGPTLPFEITEYTAGKSYTFTTKMPIGHLVISRTLSFREGHTYFTDDIQFTGFFKRFLGLLLGRGFKAVLPEVMHNFKNLLENPSTS